MYRNIIRAIAVLFAAFAAAMALPGFYRMIPASWHGDYKKIVYSEVLGDFIISKSIYSDDPSDRSGIRYEIRDSKGNAYTPEQVDTLAVLENARLCGLLRRRRRPGLRIVRFEGQAVLCFERLPDAGSVSFRPRRD